jgi:shikimate kinase
VSALAKAALLSAISSRESGGALGRDLEMKARVARRELGSGRLASVAAQPGLRPRGMSKHEERERADEWAQLRRVNSLFMCCGVLETKIHM